MRLWQHIPYAANGIQCFPVRFRVQKNKIFDQFSVFFGIFRFMSFRFVCKKFRFASKRNRRNQPLVSLNRFAHFRFRFASFRFVSLRSEMWDTLEWSVECEKWRVKSGVWIVKSGVWRGEYGVRRMERLEWGEWREGRVDSGDWRVERVESGEWRGG